MKYHVDYATETWDHCYLIVNVKDKSEVKAVLKRHMNGQPFKINRISEWKLDNHGKLVPEEG